MRKLILITIATFLFGKTQIFLRQNYYTIEDSAEVIVTDENGRSDVEILIKNVDVKYNKFSIKSYDFGQHQITIVLPETGVKQQVMLTRLPHRKNAVKIDQLTGSVLVENRPFFPFGFYCYSPVQKNIAEQEIVKGFNLMSPYQKISKGTRKKRKKYMDRCAELGMKVNFNLCSVAGGGGVGSHGGRSRLDLEETLREEVQYFKDHPALLSWYIADEPVGQKTPVEVVEKAYKIIKEIDPYHPVCVVFMTPSRAIEYSNGMDIVMTDPYPVPGGNIRVISDLMKNLQKDFRYKKPVWLVPQAFGGNEVWKREPDWRELRMMTYQGIINDTKGIQYFIRHGLNSFPKSTSAWNEAAKIALEVREISPFLLDFDSQYSISVDNTNIDINCWKKDGKLLIGLVNKDPKPQTFTFHLPEKVTNEIEVLYEHRKIDNNNLIKEFIDGYGTRFYCAKNYKQTDNQETFINPGFENNYTAMVPAGCYAKVNGDQKIANEIYRSLEEKSITNEEMGMYWKENQPSWYWYQSPVQTQSLMIEVFHEMGAEDNTMDNLKLWLLKNKQTNSWKTTKATTNAIYAILSTGSNWINENELVKVKIGNNIIDPTKLENTKIEAGTGYFKTTWNTAEIKPEMAEITLGKNSKGAAFGGLYWQYFEDLDKITSAKTGIQIRKELFLKKNTKEGIKLYKIDNKIILKLGDLITVRIEIRSDREMEFTHLKDMRASGFEPVNTLSEYKYQDNLYYYESTKDASTNFFIDHLPKGVFVFEYDMRVNNQGNFSNGITTMQSMYAPEFSSHSKGVRVNIR